jgi:hypothetical protein
MNSVRALARNGAPNNRTTRRTAQFGGGWRGAAVGRSSASPHRRISEAPWVDSLPKDAVADQWWQRVMLRDNR